MGSICSKVDSGLGPSIETRVPKAKKLECRKLKTRVPKAKKLERQYYHFPSHSPSPQIRGFPYIYQAGSSHPHSTPASLFGAMVKSRFGAMNMLGPSHYAKSRDQVPPSPFLLWILPVLALPVLKHTKFTGLAYMMCNICSVLTWY